MRGNIYLVGFMGSGKSTVGAALGRMLNLPFYDLDQLIEQALSRSIEEIFRCHGESWFRLREREALEDTSRLAPAVVALGGGAFSDPSNRDFVHSHGTSVWLRAPLELLEERCPPGQGRPLAADRAAFRRLFQERQAQYARARFQVAVAGCTPAQIAAEISAALGPQAC